jgi:O-antigen ligase
MNRLRILQRLPGMLQAAGLFLIPILTPHTAYWVLGFTPTHLDIIYELRGIVFKPADAALGMALAATLLRLVVERGYRAALRATGLRLIAQPVPRIVAALVLWMLIGVLWAEQPVLAFYQAVMTLLALVMMLALADWIHRHDSRGALTVLVLSAVFQAALTILQSLHGGAIGLGWLGETVFSEPRGRGLTFNPNTEASFLVFGLFMAVLWFRLAAHPRTWCFILLGIILGGIAATLSGGALVAAAGLGLLLWQSSVTRRQRVVLAAGICLAGMLALGIHASRGGPTLEKRLQFAFPLTLAVLQEAPIQGVGAGNLMLRADALAINEQYGKEEHFVYGQLQPAHNAYLTLWAELGLPGLLLFLLTSREIGNGLFNPPNTAALILGCCLLAVGGMMLLEFHFWLDVHWRLLLFWILGLWLGYSTQQSTDW